jgi:parallel beta-helix repeat protein
MICPDFAHNANVGEAMPARVVSAHSSRCAPGRLFRWAVVLALLPFSIQATNYYVSSSSGNDGNDGLTSQTAWQTLQRIYSKCVSTAPFRPGDSILLRSGDTWDGQIFCTASGSSVQPISIGAYGSGSKPVIYADNPTASWTPVPGHPGIYQAFVGRGSIISPLAYQQGIQLQPVTGAGLNLTKAANLETYLAALAPGGFGPTTITDTVYVHTLDGGFPSNVRIFRASAVSVSGNYLVVEGLHVQRAQVGIDVGQSANVTLRSNDVQDTLGIGIYLRGGCTACIVENNTTTRTGNTAIYVLHGSGNIIRSNKVAHVTDTILGFKVKGDQAGIGLQQSMQNLLEYNTISEVKNGAFDYYYEQGSTVRYNYAFHCGGGVFPHGTSLNVYSNIFDLRWPIKNNITGGVNAVNTGPSPILIFNNVFYGTGGYGLMGMSGAGSIPSASGTATATGSGSGPVIFRNNIVVSWQPSGILAQAGPGVDSDFNCFYAAGPSRFTRSKESYRDLTSFQSATGQEMHSVFANPRFVAVNPAQPSDFHLQPGSPCIGTGIDLEQIGIATSDYLDYAGAPFPASRPNMGAFEGSPTQNPLVLLEGEGTLSMAALTVRPGWRSIF